jgi:hypothetical protein
MIDPVIIVVSVAVISVAVILIYRHRRIAHRRKGVVLLAERERATQPTSWWWLSFVDSDKPEGQRFLGVAIVEGNGVGSASLRAHELGVNPGGEVRASRLEADAVPEARYLNRLLSRKESEQADLI